MKTVLIGIQARSTSHRLPGKATELIAGRTILDRVLEACKLALGNIRKGHNLDTKLAILTPTGDAIASDFRPRCDIVEGPENDVLERYRLAVERYDPDYVVRITGDCPVIPASVISGILNTAIRNGYDYVSNVDERFRTSIDGTDCEAMSRRAFNYLQETASDPYDREHVTPFLRREPPSWANMGLVLNFFDLSHIKFSVDTPEDLERVRAAFDSAFGKYLSAIQVYGHGKVHRV